QAGGSVWSVVGQLGPDRGGPLDHGAELGPRDVGREVAQPAVRVYDEPLGGHDVERPADSGGDQLAGLDVLGLDIHHPEAEITVPAVLADQLEVVVALPGELQDELVDVGVQDGREEEVVVPLPRWAGVAVAVTDM